MKQQLPQRSIAELEADIESARQDLAITLEELVYQMQPAVQAQKIAASSMAALESTKEDLEDLWKRLRKGEKEAWIQLAEIVGISAITVTISVLLLKRHLRVKDAKRQQRRWKKALHQLAKQGVPAGVEVSVF